MDETFEDLDDAAIENNDLENDEAPAVRLVNQILGAGVQMKASDIISIRKKIKF